MLLEVGVGKYEIASSWTFLPLNLPCLSCWLVTLLYKEENCSLQKTPPGRTMRPLPTAKDSSWVQPRRLHRELSWVRPRGLYRELWICKEFGCTKRWSLMLLATTPQCGRKIAFSKRPLLAGLERLYMKPYPSKGSNLCNNGESYFWHLHHHPLPWVGGIAIEDAPTQYTKVQESAQN